MLTEFSRQGGALKFSQLNELVEICSSTGCLVARNEGEMEKNRTFHSVFIRRQPVESVGSHNCAEVGSSLPWGFWNFKRFACHHPDNVRALTPGPSHSKGLCRVAYGYFQSEFPLK